MSSDSADLELVRKAAAGDASALELFLLRHRSQLMGFVTRHTPPDVRRTVDPQDILQDIYFDAFRRLGSFTATDQRSALRWLVTMARHRIIDLVRTHRSAKRGGGQRVDLDDGAAENDSFVLLLQDLAVYERTPSRSAVAHELLATLQRCIDTLPEDHRQAIRLHYVEGLTVEQVAAKMNRSPGAAQMLCSRGLKVLRGQLRSMSRYF
jgi:RNA polymerase sigma-70 factor (ECF subfamily)